MASSTTSKTQMPLPPPPTLPPLPPPPPPAEHRTGVEVAVRLCRDAQGYHLPRKTGSGNASVKNSIISTHLQRFCNALEKNGKTKGFEDSSITTINALNDTIVNRKKLHVSNFIKKNEKIHSIGSAHSQMLELPEEWQTEDTPYDYDNPEVGGGGGGYLLDAVVGNALALVPIPAPPHQVEDGGAIIPVVGDGDDGGGPEAGGGVLPIHPVLSVCGSMLGWQNPFNFIPRFQFSLNLDIVHGVHEVKHFIRGAYTSLFLNAGFFGSRPFYLHLLARFWRRWSSGDVIRAGHGSHMAAVLRERWFRAGLAAYGCEGCQSF